MTSQNSERDVKPIDLLFDPELYFFDFNPRDMTSRFLCLSEDIMREAPFIDIRIEPLASGEVTLPTAQLMQLYNQEPIPRPTPHFIFHHAFVASTLMAKCLDQIDAFISLKEPWILRRLADFRRQQYGRIPPEIWQKMLETKIGLLCKTYNTGRTPIIKATNVANNIVADILKVHPDSKCIYMYSDLKSFLVSNLNKTDETKEKMRGLLEGFLTDSFELPPKSFLAFEDMNIHLNQCALIWCLNMRDLQQNMSSNAARILPIHMDDFLASPADTLESICSHFGYEASDADIHAMTSDGILGVNAKDQRITFGKNDKDAQSDSIRTEHAADIQDALDWIAPLMSEWNLSEPRL